MTLYFLRHAKAHPRGAKWRPDSKRPLTREGEKKMFDVARGMKKLGLSFDLILTSPFLRARRTAEIVAEVYRAKKLFETPHLVPDADARAVIDEIHDHFSALKEILLVGHEPHLSGLISTLLIGDGGLKTEFKKAGLCQLAMDDVRYGKCATLHWLLTPRQLARLGKK